MGMKYNSGTFPNLKTKEVSYDKVSSDSYVKAINKDYIINYENADSNMMFISTDSDIDKTSDNIIKDEATLRSIKNDKVSNESNGDLKTNKPNAKRTKNKDRAISRESNISKFIELRKEAKKVITKKQLMEFLEKHKEFKVSSSLQNVHRKGTAEFKEDKSIVFGSLSRCQRLIMRALRKMEMNSDNFILVHSILPLGKVTTRTGKVKITRYGKLHFGKKGAHIVPTLVNLKDWRQIK